MKILKISLDFLEHLSYNILVQTCATAIIVRKVVGTKDIELFTAIFNSFIRANKYIDDEIWEFKTTKGLTGQIYLNGNLEYEQIAEGDCEVTNE